MDQLSSQRSHNWWLTLNISWKLHIPYHPQLLGKVERANGLLKDQLTELSLDVKTSWPDLLPVALTRL